MRILLITVAAVVPALAQGQVQIVNKSRPGADGFQIGDRYEITISGAAGQPVSVRATAQGRIDWSPVIGQTDENGRWSATGQFEKADLGGWSELWTVGGKLARPALQFSVKAPCLPGGTGMQFNSGPNSFLQCQTATGMESFSTVSRPAPTNLTAEQYHGEVLENFMLGAGVDEKASFYTGLNGDAAARAIAKRIGPNALSDEETVRLLGIVRAAYRNVNTVLFEDRPPVHTLELLRHLVELAETDGLKQQIWETIAYVQSARP
jgi:hypothetical protein